VVVNPDYISYTELVIAEVVIVAEEHLSNTETVIRTVSAI
jgi:hypothetical protein